ncbi:MAG: hypothetical protein Q4C70_11530 [Planctomycetia bacterium]|nr:hypothetical protein [Planctomycetia bacterium]
MIARIYYGTAFPDHSVVLLARVVGEYSEVLKRKELSSCTYSASLIDPVFPDRATPIEGHQDVQLDLDAVFFNALQNDNSWTLDADGYNFRHIPDISEFPLFSHSRRLYKLDYTFTPTEENRLPIRIQFHILTY